MAAALAALLSCVPTIEAQAQEKTTFGTGTPLSVQLCRGLPEGQLLLIPVPASQRESRQESAATALARLANCENDADFLTRLGAALNTLGRHDEALEHLERALLLRPDEPLARYSYAWALAELGDTAAARELLNELSPWAAPGAQRDPLARARVQLLSRLPSAPGTSAGPGHGADLAAHARRATTSNAGHLNWHQGASRSRLQAQWQLSTGHESNLLGAPSATSLNLTITGLPSGETVTINVPLDQSVRPRPGGYQQTAGQLRWQQQRLNPLAEGVAGNGADALGDQPNTLTTAHSLLPPRQWRLWEWDGLLALRHRYAPSAAGAGYTQADAAIDMLSRRVQVTPDGLQPSAWAPALRWPDSYATLGVTALQSESGVRYASAQAAAGWQLPWQGACDLRLGLEGQERRYGSNPVLNGRYVGAVGVWRCLVASKSTGPIGLSLQLRSGRDQPNDDARPGGDQTQRGLRLGLNGARWLVELDNTQQADSGPYSALIEAGASRSLRRTSARAEWVQALPFTALRFVLGTETSVQRSNIVLFDTRNSSVYLALRGSSQ
jgi:tetratricopeptide (TPR) repeat protein